MASARKLLLTWFPGTSSPFICGAPMLHASGATLAVAVKRAGGLGNINTVISLCACQMRKPFCEIDLRKGHFA